MNQFPISIIIISAVILITLPFLSRAVEESFTIPGPSPASAGPAGWVNNFYSFSLLISGVLAFGAIVYGGIKYTFAAGNPSGQSEGKEWVKGALLGLLLLGGAYLILQTINPELVSLRLAGLPALAPTSASAPAGSDGSGTSSPYTVCFTGTKGIATSKGAVYSSQVECAKNADTKNGEFCVSGTFVPYGVPCL